MLWRVYYDDGRTYSDEDGALEDAPGDGVIAIAQIDPDVGRHILHMKDFYYREHSRWYGCDIYGLFDYLRRLGWKKVIAGRNTTSSNYHAIMDRARLDPGLPEKNALLAGEMRPRD